MCSRLHTQTHTHPLLANSDREFDRVYGSFLTQEDFGLCLILYFMNTVLPMSSHHVGGESMKTFAKENKRNLSQDIVGLCRERVHPISKMDTIEFRILSSSGYLVGFRGSVEVPSSRYGDCGHRCVL